MSLRTQLTIAFLLLTLIPSTIFSITALQRIVAVNELWESAGMNVFLESSLSTATRSLERLEYDLEHAAAPLVARWQEHVPIFADEPRERLYVTRYLEDVSFDFAQIYAPTDSGYVLVSEAYVARLDLRIPDLSADINAHDPASNTMQSPSTGAFAYVGPIAAGHRAVVGYLLEPEFFANYYEGILGMAIIQEIEENARKSERNTIILILSLLVGVAVIAFLGGWYLSHRLAGPVTQLSEHLDAMRPGQEFVPVPQPRRATPEVRALTQAFNDLTTRLRRTQIDLLRTERVAGSAQVARHVAHEIKNHLSTLGLATHRLERRLSSLPSDEQQVSRDALEAMRKEFEVLEDMAETFSELGRMAEPLNRSPLQLNHLCSSVATLYREGPVEFELDLEEELPLVDGDERSLRRVLSNLVKNAIEAQGAGGTITVRTHSGSGCVFLEVRDAGPGISEEVRARVFEAGFSTKSRGSGVGLFLARAVVEKHGGRIEIESAAGLGTVVRVEIPAARADRTAA